MRNRSIQRGSWARWLVIATASSAVLAACIDTQTREQDAAVAAMSSCEKVQALIRSHDLEFERVRNVRRTANMMDVWTTRYHLVGDSCQVWDWGGGNSSYVCSVVSPNEELAREMYNRAIKVTRECLDEDWALSERKRKLGTGDKAIFRKPGEDSAVATHVIETPGIFKSEWTTYYFVGDSTDEL